MQTNLNQNKLIVSWCLYEGAQSAFAPVIMTLVFAPYFARFVAPTPLEGAIQWSHAMVFAGIVLLLLAPVIGFISDFTGKKKIWLIFFTLLCMISSALLWYANPHTSHVFQILTLIVIGMVSMEVTHIMHNSLLSTIASRDQLSLVSGWSRGTGYLATLISLGIVYFILEHCDFAWVPFANHSPDRVRLCGPLVAIWFCVFSLPLLLNLSEEKVEKKSFSVTNQITNLVFDLKSILALKDITYFLLASILYIDALNTLTVMGGIYCSTIYQISSANMIIYGIIMSITAGTGAMCLGWLVKKFGEKLVLLYALVALFLLITIMFVMHSLAIFVICSFFASIAIGIIYGASRSMLARIAPKDKMVEIFSLYAISGKITSFLGPFIAGVIMQYFHNQAFGMLVVPVFILLGMMFLLRVQYTPEVLQA